MPARVLAIALNTYREAVRARLLLGVFAAALATSLFTLVIAALSLHNELRVVADLTAASASLYGVLIAIILGATSLYRELELKTVFPILSRPIHRWEYLLGKYLGIVATGTVFLAIDAAVALLLLALEADQASWKVALVGVGMPFALGVGLLVARGRRVFVFIPWSLLFGAAAWVVAGPALDERQLLVASALLSACEVAIVAAVATFFASFSSPFLTAAFTAMVFVIGRRADSLAHLPVKVFGGFLAGVGHGFARVVPNLQAYVPPRPLLLGQVAGTTVWGYVASAGLHAVFYVALLLAAGTLAFARRDFA